MIPVVRSNQFRVNQVYREYTSMERIVVVGAGQAAGWAVSTLRQEGFQGEIHEIGRAHV